MPDKKRERYYFDILRKAVPEFASGEVIEFEAPDFILVAGSKRLGFELTMFHLPPGAGQRPYQEQQSLKDHIVSISERIHAASGGSALYVGVYFSQNDVLTKATIQPLASAIAEAVLNAPTPRSMSEPVELRFGAVPRGISGIQIHPSVDGIDKLWHEDAGGWISDITPAHVSDVIEAKSRMAMRARQHCDELVLVIVHDDFSNSAPAAITAEALASHYNGPFDGVIWLSPHSSSPIMKLACIGAS